MSNIKDLFILVNRSDIEGDSDTGAGEAASGGSSGGGYTPNASVADQVSIIQARERIIEAEGYEANFKSETAADMASPMASIAAVAALALTDPAMSNNMDSPNMTHVEETAIASMIVQPKVDLEGNAWRPSEMANTTKFFDNQAHAHEVNTSKLENTEQAIEGLAQTHSMLMGAAHDIKVDKYNAQNGGPAAGASPDAGKPSAGGIATGAAVGWGASAVANAILPGAGAPIQMISAAVTGVQSAALTFGGDGSSNKYDMDRKPRSKSEAAAMKSDSSYFQSSNPYDGTTSGQMMQSSPPSPATSAFGEAVAADPQKDALQDTKSMQIALLEEAAGKIWAQGEEQTEHHKNALEADDTHTEYVESGGADFDTHELFRAADKGAMNDVQETALIHASKAENPDVIEKIEQRFELKNLDLAMGGSFSKGPRPK